MLFLVVELCALTFRKDDVSKSNIIASALFGDGAAGAILSTDGDGPAIGAVGEHTWPDSLDVMGWDIEEDGLQARLKRLQAGLLLRLLVLPGSLRARQGQSARRGRLGLLQACLLPVDQVF